MNDSILNRRAIAWIVWLIASIFYAYQYVLRVMPNIFMNDIMQQFGIGAGAFGQVSGIYYIGYSLAHLPIGIMLDRYGPKKIMSGCIFMSAAGLIPLFLGEHWSFPIDGRFLTGIGSSAAILGLFKIIRMAFSEAKFARMVSFAATIGLIGAIYGGGPLSWMRNTFGYETVMIVLALVGVALACFTYWIIPDQKTSEEGNVVSDLKEALSNKKVLLCCFFAGLMVGPLEGFADVWGSAFLKNVYGYEGSSAAVIPSWIFVGMCFGAPVLSFVAEKIGNYLIAIVGAGVAMAAGFSTMLALHVPQFMLSLSFVLVGICCAYQILAIYKATTYAPQRLAGMTSAIANMIIMVFGYVFHATMGGIINALGGPESAHALSYGVAVIPIALCAGTVGFVILLVKERKVLSIETG